MKTIAVRNDFDYFAPCLHITYVTRNMLWKCGTTWMHWRTSAIKHLRLKTIFRGLMIQPGCGCSRLLSPFSLKVSFSLSLREGLFLFCFGDGLFTFSFVVDPGCLISLPFWCSRRHGRDAKWIAKETLSEWRLVGNVSKPAKLSSGKIVFETANRITINDNSNRVEPPFAYYSWAAIAMQDT